MLPPEFGRWKTVYGYFNSWSRKGGWQTIMEALTRQERLRQGRRPTPSAGCVDAQRVKTATQGKTKGSDAGKQIHERKRHVLVDPLGLVMEVLVTDADADERDGLRGRLSAFFAGGGPTAQKAVGRQRLPRRTDSSMGRRVEAQLQNRPGGGKKTGGRLCRGAAPLGRRADLCLAVEFSAPFEKL